jgi:hypothetical protein
VDCDAAGFGEGDRLFDLTPLEVLLSQVHQQRYVFDGGRASGQMGR